MKYLLSLAMLFFIFSSSVQAGVIIGGTRVIYPENDKNVSLTVENPDESPYLIQSWIENAENNEQSAFAITPPLFRLNSEQANTLRILLTENTLPQDKESLFWLNIKSIPASERIDNTLQIAFKTQIKLIYRPSSIKDFKLDEERKKLTWSIKGDQLTVKNPTPFYMNFQRIYFENKPLEDVSYAAPFSSQSFTVDNAASHGTVKWEVINDYGSVDTLDEIKI